MDLLLMDLDVDLDIGRDLDLRHIAMGSYNMDIDVAENPPLPLTLAPDSRMQSDDAALVDLSTSPSPNLGLTTLIANSPGFVDIGRQFNVDPQALLHPHSPQPIPSTPTPIVNNINIQQPQGSPTSPTTTLSSSQGIMTPPPSPDSPLVPDSNIYTFRVSASWRPKTPRSKLPDLVKEDCGEDAYYFTEQEACWSLGLGDGVGGWGSFGVDPSLFAWDLMSQCAQVSNSYEIPDPQEVLAEGYQRVLDRGVVKAGSSTACIVTLEKATGQIKATNLGDSGLMVFRMTAPPSFSSDSESGLSSPARARLEAPHSDNEIEMSEDEYTSYNSNSNDFNHYYHYFGAYRPVFSTTERQHYFNAPFQLSVIPPEMAADSTNITDSPADAIQSVTHLRNGDVVVMASDGLWDNMYWEEVVQVLERELGTMDLSWLEQSASERSSSSTVKMSDAESKKLEEVVDEMVEIELEELPEEQRGKDRESTFAADSERKASITTAAIVAPPAENATVALAPAAEATKETVSSDAVPAVKDGNVDGKESRMAWPTPPSTTYNSPSNTPFPSSPVPSTPDYSDHEMVFSDRQSFLKNLDEKVRRVAEILTDEAAALSRNPRRLSPFAKSARMNGRAYSGGKIDDVTVIVAVVVHLPTDAISGTPMVSSGILDPTSR